MMRFQDKVAIVTGGNKNIGQAIARRLTSEGARVFTMQRGGDGEHESVQVDLSNSADIKQGITSIIKQTQQLDILVNNAGIMKESPIDDVTLADWNHHIAVNLTAPFLMIQATLPYLRQRQGTIINIGSIEGLGANPDHAAYCASKAGLHGLTRSVAVDCGPHNVRCNAVAPGWVNTSLNDDFIETMNNPIEFRKNIGSIHPVRRTGDSDEVASLVAFLASNDSSFITGQVYVIDGGRMAQLSLP